MKMHTCFFLAVALCLVPVTANAYIDPGTGALVVQMLVGALITALATVKLWWKQLLRLVRREPGEEKPEDHP